MVTTIELEQPQPEQPLAVSNIKSNQDNSNESDLEPEMIEKWLPTVDAVLDATRSAFPSGPQGTSGPEPDHQEFRHYWHGVFTQLADTIAADPAIPEQLASPPIKKFMVNLFDRPHPMCCPCSLPDVDPTITLENEIGVTKMDLVRGLRDYLYGEESPEINDEDGEAFTMDTALLYTFDWMSGGYDDDGNRISYYFKQPKIFLYCCRFEDFREETSKFDEEQPKKRPKSKAA